MVIRVRRSAHRLAAGRAALAFRALTTRLCPPIIHYNMYVAMRLGAGGRTLEQQELFTTGQACRLAGATARQLDYWAWTGFLQPSGGGAVKRRYSFDDLIRIRVVMRLKDQGITLQMIRRAVDKLREHSTDPLRELSLVGLNGEVFIFRNRAEAVRVLDGQSAFLFMDIGVVAREMDELCSMQHARARPQTGHQVA